MEKNRPVCPSTVLDYVMSVLEKSDKETLAIFTADEELQEAIAKWIQRRKCAELLSLWVKQGCSILVDGLRTTYFHHIHALR